MNSRRNDIMFEYEYIPLEINKTFIINPRTISPDDQYNESCTDG